MKLFFKEYFLHENQGIQWLNSFEKLGTLGNKINEIKIMEQIREILLNDKDVKKIIVLENNYKNFDGKYDIKIEVLISDNTILAIE